MKNTLDDDAKKICKLAVKRLDLIETQIEKLEYLKHWNTEKLTYVQANIRLARQQIQEWFDEEVDLSNPER
jgi:hypothetical protein